MKQTEIIELSTEDLKEKLNNLKKSYQDLKMTHIITPLESPIQLRAQRRSIARVATELTKRASK